ncbi:MAG: 16S rRNA (adenine(1518)-N(6)/adenine(1519)-N(6))-dimethyltransferase RsmA [Candidatus Omnitrophota bacterium]
MNINELKKLWQEHGFRPLKRLGQNFLIDKNVRDNILGELQLDGESVVVEIGAGFGVMSFEVADRVKKIFAVEKDAKICEIMAPLFGQKKNLELICEDILKLDLQALVPRGERLLIFGNIPYYITTPVIEKIIEQRESVKSAYIMMQDEVARRIVALPGSKEYGALSCFVQFYTKAEKAFKVSKNSFYPKPKVDSCLLKMEIFPEPQFKVGDKELMFKVIRKAFLQRRKKILNSLAHAGFMSMERDEWQRLLESCDIDLSSRAENLSLSDYVRISDAISED